jgi:hypothetical protein
MEKILEDYKKKQTKDKLEKLFEKAISVKDDIKSLKYIVYAKTINREFFLENALKCKQWNDFRDRFKDLILDADTSTKKKYSEIREKLNEEAKKDGLL